jgi:NAD(P)H-dependent FMN reductase
MPGKPRVLAFAASARRESVNRKFLATAVEAARAAGGEVTLIDLNEFEMPLYHGDLEEAQGMPPNALRLIGLIREHAGLLIASPEYNSMITPLLKNTVDWCSRPDENPFHGKVAAIVSASPGAFGGVLSLRMAQLLMLGLGCHVVPGKVCLPHAYKAFDPQGRLTDEHALKSVQALVARLLQELGRPAG